MAILDCAWICVHAWVNVLICPRMCAQAREAVRTGVNMCAHVGICAYVWGHAQSSTRVSLDTRARMRSCLHALEHEHTHVFMPARAQTCAQAQNGISTHGTVRISTNIHCAVPLMILPISISIT